MLYKRIQRGDTEYQREKSPVSVFVVTNNRDGWEALEDSFNQEGIQLFIFSNAEALIQSLQKNPKPHLFVIDLQKRRTRDQGPDGFQIATLLKGGGPFANIPLLLIDDTLEESRKEWFFVQSDVTVRRYGEPKIHKHAIKKLLLKELGDDGF